MLTRDEQIAEDIKNDDIFKKDRRGKPYDSEFVKFLYDKFYGSLEKQENKQSKRKVKKKK